MKPLGILLTESVLLHGHMCPGQVLGVRMAVLGCRLAGVEDPASTKDLFVYVEIDRCVTDAIQAVTGCKLGKRTLKYQDYGKVAATFVNVNAGIAFRVVARDDSREAASQYAPEGLSRKEAQTHAYRVMPDDKLFNIMEVRVEIPAHDLPGPPVSRVTCEACGEGVNDRREILAEGRTLCLACAYGAYYTTVDGRYMRLADSAARSATAATALKRQGAQQPSRGADGES